MTGSALPLVIVTHEGPSERLRRCLDAVVGGGGANPIVVVDNSGLGTEHSNSTTADSVVDVVVVRTVNRGYGAAANEGFAEARRRCPESTMMALINDDVIVTPGWLAPLVDAVESGWDVAQPKLLMMPSPSPSPSPSTSASTSASTSMESAVVNSVGVELDASGAGHDIGSGQPDGLGFDGTSDIEIFTGGAFLATTDFLDVTGGFDERYFLYYEDVDLALRGAEMQQRYACVAGSVVWHEGGASTGQLGDLTRQLQERNRLWCAFRFGSAGTVVRATWLSAKRLRHHPRSTHRTAMLHGLGGAVRRCSERATAAWRSRGVAERQVVVHGGVNLLGYHDAASGLGAAVRQLRRSFEAAGVPVSIFDVASGQSPRLGTAAEEQSARIIRPTTIAVVTALELPAALAARPQLRSVGQVVGYWFWELSAIPETHRAGIELVDAIWAPTEFIADAYRAVPDGRPVVHQPMYLPRPDLDAVVSADWRRRIAPNDEFVFLVSLDLFSIVERKNPFGAIDAFAAAFPTVAAAADTAPDAGRPVTLLIKTLNGEQRSDSLQRIERHIAASGVADRIEILDAFVEEADMTALVAAADCLVSLHRGEGLGLHLSEAMWLDTPVIASRYSGNLDFMDDECAALIGVTLTDVEFGEGAYPDDFQWADPDTGQAAAWMERLAGDPSVAAELATAARQRMETQPSEADRGHQYATTLRSSAAQS